MTAPDLRTLLAATQVTHVPGVYDPASTALAVRAGNRAVHLSAAAIAATMLGTPGLDYAPATQIADRAALLAGARAGVPLLADADIGFDTPEHAVWTALAYERAGISGIVTGDGIIPALAEQVPSMVLIAQVDGTDLAEVAFQARSYVAAGADAILPTGIDEVHALARLHEALPGTPLVLARSETGPATAHLPDTELAALGVRLVLHPLAPVLAAMRAASVAYRAILDEGSADSVDRMPLAVLTPPSEAPRPAAKPAARVAPPPSRPAPVPAQPVSSDEVPAPTESPVAALPSAPVLPSAPALPPLPTAPPPSAPRRMATPPPLTAIDRLDT